MIIGHDYSPETTPAMVMMTPVGRLARGLEGDTGVAGLSTSVNVTGPARSGPRRFYRARLME